MTLLQTAAVASAATSLALSACDTIDDPRTGAEAEIANAGNLNSNGSAQPGGAGPSPNGGVSNPGTSGTVTSTPGPGPH